MVAIPESIRAHAEPALAFADSHGTLTRVILWVVAVPLLLGALNTYKEYAYRSRAKKHGCDVPKYISGFPFGLRTARLMYKAFKEDMFVKGSAEQFYEYNADTVRLQNVGATSTVTMDPENIKAVLATQFKDFDLGARYPQFKPLLGDGIFTLSGNGWHHSRTLLRPQFANEQVSRLQDIEHHVQILNELFTKKSAKGYFDAQDLFFKLTLDTATDFLFGESVDTLKMENGVANEKLLKANEFANAFNDGQIWLLYRAVAQSVYPLVTGPSFKKDIKVCQKFVEEYVDKALVSANERDNDEKKKAAFENPDRYIFLDELTRETRDPVLMRDQAINILLAGRDTTAGTLSFSIARLVRHPDIFKKLREAVLADFGTTTDNITFSTLKRCEYLKNFINEVLRFYPIVPVNARRANRDTTLPRGGGPDESKPVFIPKGDEVLYSTYALHHNVKIWGPDVEEFKPERWENSKIPNWAYIPFNGGPRICLGQQFALTEVGYTLVRILQTFKEIRAPANEINEEIKQAASLTAAVAGGVHVQFVPA